MKTNGRLYKRYLVYTKRSSMKTAKGFADNTIRTLTPYLLKYQDFTTHYCYDTLMAWFDTLDISNASKSVIASGMGRFMWIEGYISMEELKKLKYSYRVAQRSWSNISMDKDVLKAILDSCYSADDWIVKRDKAILMMLAVTGMRVSQVAGLKTDTVCFDDSGIKIYSQLQKQYMVADEDLLDLKYLPKGSGIAGHDFSLAIMDYINNRPRMEDTAFFINRYGAALSVKGIQRVVDKWAEPHGVHFTPHMFRHNLVTTVVAKFGIAAGAAVAGHSSIQTTMRYVKKSALDVSHVYSEL